MPITWPFRYLVIAGGAERGLAYCGALHALRKIAHRSLNRVFEGFAGTSIGAAIALLVAIGYEPSEIVAAWVIEPPTWPIDMHGFLEADVQDYGAPTGKACTMACLDDSIAMQWLSRMLARRLPNSDPTFAELHDWGVPDLVVCGTCVMQRRPIYYSWKTTPDARVLIAVRASMAIAPLVAPQYDRLLHDFVVDGGFADNFPFETSFGAPRATLGLCFAPNTAERSVPRTRIDYVYDMFTLAFYCHQVWRLEQLRTLVFANDDDAFRCHVVELSVVPSTFMRLDLAVSRRVASAWFEQGWEQLWQWWERSRRRFGCEKGTGGSALNRNVSNSIASTQGEDAQQNDNDDEQNDGARPPGAAEPNEHRVIGDDG